MNKVTLIGRLTKDVDTKLLAGGNSVHNFTLAVQRKGKKDEVDFIPCVMFGKGGEIVSTYVNKGAKLAVAGEIQTGSFVDNEGNKRYTTQVKVDDFEFCESKRD